jgi:hypothetical protein
MINSPLEGSSWNNCLTIARNEGRLMVTFVTIKKTVMVDDTENEIEYIKTNLLKLERTSTIRVKQEGENSEPWVIDILDSSEDEISRDELDDTEEEEEVEKEEEGTEEIVWMSEDDSESGIIWIKNNEPTRDPPCHNVELEHKDFEIQNAPELNQVDADSDNIALTELHGANDPNVQAQKLDQADNADVDW